MKAAGLCWSKPAKGLTAGVLVSVGLGHVDRALGDSNGASNPRVSETARSVQWPQSNSWMASIHILTVTTISSPPISVSSRGAKDPMVHGDWPPLVLRLGLARPGLKRWHRGSPSCRSQCFGGPNLPRCWWCHFLAILTLFSSALRMISVCSRCLRHCGWEAQPPQHAFDTQWGSQERSLQAWLDPYVHWVLLSFVT